MNNYLSKIRIPNFWGLSIVSIFILMIFLTLECKKSISETSLLTGDCKFDEVVATFVPNPVTIMAGETAEIEVQVTVHSNCENYLKSFWVNDINDTIGPPESGLCTSTDLIDNRGTCNISVYLEQGSQEGTIQRKYKITACSQNYYDGSRKKSVIADLDVHVLTSSSDYRLAMVPATISVIQGRSFSITASIERLGGHSESIDMSLQNLPPRLSYVYDPNPIPGDQNSSQLTITAEPNAIPGDDYSIRAFCTDGTIERFVNFPLYVIEPFTLSVDPATISITQGQAGTVDVNVENRIGGFSDWVMLTIESTIIGQGTNLVDTTFNPNPVPPVDVHTSELTFTVGESVPPGTYPITINGVGGNVPKTTELQLTVSEQRK